MLRCTLLSDGAIGNVDTGERRLESWLGFDTWSTWKLRDRDLRGSAHIRISRAVGGNGRWVHDRIWFWLGVPREGSDVEL